MVSWTRLRLESRRQRDCFPMLLWCFRIALTAIYSVELVFAIKKNVKPPEGEGVTFSGGSLGQEVDCKDKLNVTCDNIW
jgi:hypothetical protein